MFNRFDPHKWHDYNHSWYIINWSKRDILFRSKLLWYWNCYLDQSFQCLSTCSTSGNYFKRKIKSWITSTNDNNHASNIYNINLSLIKSISGNFLKAYICYYGQYALFYAPQGTIDEHLALQYDVTQIISNILPIISTNGERILKIMMVMIMMLINYHYCCCLDYSYFRLFF